MGVHPCSLTATESKYFGSFGLTNSYFLYAPSLSSSEGKRFSIKLIRRVHGDLKEQPSLKHVLKQTAVSVSASYDTDKDRVLLSSELHQNSSYITALATKYLCDLHLLSSPVECYL